MTPAKMFKSSDLRQRCSSSRFCRSGAFVLNGAICQYGHNCQPPAAGVSPRLHHDGEKYIPGAFCCLHIRIQRGSDSICSLGKAELPQIYTPSHSCRDGGGDESWKTTEMLEYMYKKTKNSKLSLHNELPRKEVARSLSGTMFRPQREFTSD